MIKIKRFYQQDITTRAPDAIQEQLAKSVEEQCEQFINEKTIRVISLSVVAIDNKPKLYLMYEEPTIKHAHQL